MATWALDLLETTTAVVAFRGLLCQMQIRPPIVDVKAPMTCAILVVGVNVADKVRWAQEVT